jgi:hypothetical protein
VFIQRLLSMGCCCCCDVVPASTYVANCSLHIEATVFTLTTVVALLETPTCTFMPSLLIQIHDTLFARRAPEQIREENRVGPPWNRGTSPQSEDPSQFAHTVHWPSVRLPRPDVIRIGVAAFCSGGRITVHAREAP